MGIKGLGKFLKEKCPRIYHRDVPFSAFKYKKIAIDTSLYIWKYKFSFGDLFIQGFCNFICALREAKIHPIFVFDGKSPPEKTAEKDARKLAQKTQKLKLSELEEDLKVYLKTNVISEALHNRYNSLVKNDCDEFNYELIDEYLTKQRNNDLYKPCFEDITAIKEMLDVFNLTQIQAHQEAEILCSQLCKQNLVSGVLSADTDVLASKCPITLVDVNTTTKTFKVVIFSEI